MDSLHGRCQTAQQGRKIRQNRKRHNKPRNTEVCRYNGYATPSLCYHFCAQVYHVETSCPIGRWPCGERCRTACGRDCENCCGWICPRKFANVEGYHGIPHLLFRVSSVEPGLFVLRRGQASFLSRSLLTLLIVSMSHGHSSLEENRRLRTKTATTIAFQSCIASTSSNSKLEQYLVFFTCLLVLQWPIIASSMPHHYFICLNCYYDMFCKLPVPYRVRCLYTIALCAKAITERRRGSAVACHALSFSSL